MLRAVICLMLSAAGAHAATAADSAHHAIAKASFGRVGLVRRVGPLVEERSQAAGPLAANLLGHPTRLADEQEVVPRQRQQAARRPGQGPDRRVWHLGRPPARARRPIGQAGDADLAVRPAEGKVPAGLVERRRDRTAGPGVELALPLPAPIGSGDGLGQPAITPHGPQGRVLVEAQRESADAIARPPMPGFAIRQ